MDRTLNIGTTGDLRVLINVSGVLFETRESTLQRYPETLLGDCKKREEYLCSYTNQYFFNRNRNSFEAILFFYQSAGKLLRPPDIDMKTFEAECKFFQLPHPYIASMKSKETGLLNDLIAAALKQKNIPNTGCRHKIWDFLEHPETSTIARNFAFFSLFALFSSVVTAIIESVPQLQVETKNITDSPWFMIELVLNSWFLFEFLLRLLFSPSKKDFFKSTLNWIDTIVIVPYFIILAVAKNAMKSIGFIRALRLLRIIRLLRLSKHSSRMKVIGIIVKDSLQDLHLFAACLMIIVIFGGSVMYYVENIKSNSPFTSIPESMWWAIQTWLTVGYGDIYPETALGKLLAALFMVFGVATICLPVLSLIMKFTAYLSTDHDEL